MRSDKSSMFEIVQQALLREAELSPNLLSDVAGLEHYISETYHSRSLPELLQNADDAGSTKFKVWSTNNHVFVANNGREFTSQDFENLCRSAHSSKTRGESIGYRGIGFKSVVNFANEIHLISGQLEATFSRELTAKLIPKAKIVPLIRIPHPVLDVKRKSIEREIEVLLGEGYTTIFAFADLIPSEIEVEFASFDLTSLLFLHNVTGLELWTTTKDALVLEKKRASSDMSSIKMVSSKGTTLWKLVDRKSVALAFASEGKNIIRLEEKDAVVHAFLPTEEATGFSFKINGDFSTDPSRRHVILDENSMSVMRQAAELISELIFKAIWRNENSEFANVIPPTIDPRVIAFRKPTFSVELLKMVKEILGGKIGNLMLCPQWLNSEDFEQLARRSDILGVEEKTEKSGGLRDFLRFLGVREATLQDLKNSLKAESLTITGCAETTSHLMALYFTRQLGKAEIDKNWRIWRIGNSTHSLAEASNMNSSLDKEFLDMLSERSQGVGQIRRFLMELTDKSVSDALLPESLIHEEETAISEPASQKEVSSPNEKNRPIKGIVLKKWRSKEQNVLEALNRQGYNAMDVSAQNLGYDIEALTPDGEKILIEVKSIDYPGQPIVLTSNEVALAREKGETYYIVIAQQTENKLKMAWIQNPLEKLQLTRVCRQWVWQCSSYKFIPSQTFPVE